MDYLAFDFGDGTTTAAHYNDSFMGIEPQVLRIAKGEDEIWSCIGFDKNGINPPLIGKNADAPNVLVKTNWKSYPSKYCDTEEGRENRKTAIAFMRAVFSSFLVQNPDYGSDGTYRGEPCKIVIGVPCDWTHEDIEEYRQMATEAGIPRPEVVKESQAGMFYARRWMRGGISDDSIRNGVLMIDVGSSTTDFTYLHGADVVRHRGIPLGAAKVEEMFLAEGIKRENVRYWPISGESRQGLRILADDMEEGDSSYKTDLMEVRGHKEAYFTKADSMVSPNERVPSLPISEVKIGECGYIVENFVDYCLDDSSSPCSFCLTNVSDVWDYDAKVEFAKPKVWREHFRTALEYIKDCWEIDCDVQIVVTGGATRMQFIEEDIKYVFDSEEDPYFGNDGARSFSVVKGLAWACFAREQITKTRHEVDEMLKKEDVYRTVGIYEFVDRFLEKPAKEMADIVRGELAKFLSCGGEIDRLGERHSHFVCREWNNFLDRLRGDGVNIKCILDNPSPIRNETLNLYENFGRPSVRIDTDVAASFDFHMVESAMGFAPLEGYGFLDAIFSSKRNHMLKAVSKNVNEDYMIGKFKSKLFDVADGKELPSMYERLCSAILKNFREFKLSEIDAIGGFVEYK